MGFNQIRHLVERPRRASAPPSHRGEGRALVAAIALLGLLHPALCAREYLPADPSTLEAALSRAGLGLVPVLLVQGEEACPEVLAFLRDPRVVRALGRNLPLVISVARHPAVAERLGARRLPVVFLLDGGGREAARLAGLDPEAFAQRSRELSGAARSPATEEACADAGDPLGLAARARRALGDGARYEATLLFERAARAFEEKGSSALGRSLEEAEAVARARLSIAEHLASLGEHPKAERHHAAALAALRRRDARSAELHLLRAEAGVGLALASRGQGRLAEARETLTCLLEGSLEAPPLEGPGRERALFLLARLLVEAADDEAARERFSQCAREYPGSRYGERARLYLAAPAAADLSSAARGSSP